MARGRHEAGHPDCLPSPCCRQIKTTEAEAINLIVETLVLCEQAPMFTQDGSNRSRFRLAFGGLGISHWCAP
jgi:hypothetical protein